MKITEVFRGVATGLIVLFGALYWPSNLGAEPLGDIGETSWIHGSADCEVNNDPPIQVFQQDASTYVLRQSKCLSFEAPFMYLLLGSEQALLLDTGATDDPDAFPLYETVRPLIGERQLLVLHSHSHGDHRRGDSQFTGKPDVDLIEPSETGLGEMLGDGHVFASEHRIQLGGREMVIFEIPGHQEESIAVYDSQTRWLLTGDTVYPGLVYVKDWEAYRDSISRLARFAEDNEVSAVLGAHIEMMDKAGEHYPIGTVYQPSEAPLPLSPVVLQRLETAMAKSDGEEAVQLDELVVQPMNGLQKAISNLARFITQ